jgi:hypothetical protein
LIDARQFRLTLGPVHRGKGRRVDDHIRAQAPNRCSQTVQVGQIAGTTVGQHAVTVQRDHFTEWRQAALQFPAHLSVPTQQEQSHVVTNPAAAVP